MKQAPIEVWIDGSCPLCETSRLWVQERDDSKAVCFRDFRTAPDSTLPVDRDRHEQAMMLRTADGEIVSGFSALREILHALPRWRWLGFLIGIPPISWVGAAVYPLVARSRYIWSKLLRPRA